MAVPCYVGDVAAPPEKVQIKVCGLTRVQDVAYCAELGVDAIGLNFWPGSPRCIDLSFAKSMVEAFPTLEFVGVFVDASVKEIQHTRVETGLCWVQLHGEETPLILRRLQPHAYKALGVRAREDLDHVASFGGSRILLDSRSLLAGAMPGGMGETFDWDLLHNHPALRDRHLTLAGGLDAENVTNAIVIAQPDRVDTASGVESSPGIKDRTKLGEFVDAVRSSS